MLISCALLFLATGVFSATVIRFTNVECEMIDPSFASFERCDLKVIARGVVGLNIHFKLTQTVTNAKINLSLWRKFNGYRPFMFNMTFDFCKTMDQTNQTLTFPKLLFEAVSKTSNINHSCPYDHDIIVRNMVTLEEHYKYLPLPSGQYKYQLIMATNHKWIAVVKFYILRQEDIIKS